MTRPFDLMEHRRVGGVGILAVGLAGDHDADRRLLRLHGADLHRRRMRAQKLALAVRAGLEEEGVVHLARRVSFREIQRGEIVVVRLDIRSFGDREAEIAEDRRDLVDDLADRMDAAALGRRLADRQRHVDFFRGKARSDRGVASIPPCGRSSASVTRFFSPLIAGPLVCRSSGLMAPRVFSILRDRALLAERRDTHRLDRLLVGGCRDVGSSAEFSSRSRSLLFSLTARSLIAATINCVGTSPVS